jgi:plasmid stabilization system protein ParE
MLVVWSKLAIIDYWKNIEYLENEWTLTEVYNFIDKVEKLNALLSTKNVAFKPSSYRNTLQVPVVKQVTLYYRVEGDKIELLRFWNNYQNPENLAL